jgi:hypothetical protein
MVEGGGDAFWFDKYRSKSLVPYHQPRERHTNLKGAAFHLPQVCVQYRIAVGCGNTPCASKGYCHNRLCGTIAQELFCNAKKSTSEASPPTYGGDAFAMKLVKNHRFGSSGLNLAFDGLLLGAAFGAARRVPSTNPSSQDFGSRCFLSLKRSVCQVLQGSTGVGGLQVEAQV